MYIMTQFLKSTLCVRQNHALGERHLVTAFVDQSQRVAVARNLLLGAALGCGVSEHQRFQPRCCDHDPFETVGRLGRLDHGHLPQVAQHFGRLGDVQALFAPVLPKSA